MVDLFTCFKESISPDRYVLFSSESKSASYAQGNVYLGFAGTHTGDLLQTVTDWLLNGMMYQIPYPLNSLNAKAHNGFMLAMASCAGIEGFKDRDFTFSLKNPLFSEINALVEGFISKGYQQVNLYLGGHSQGGAVATLMAPVLKSLLEDTHGTTINLCTEVYTYGAPRSCNSALAVNYMDMVDACYRYQNVGDPVPFIPPGKYGLLAAAFNADLFIEQFLGEYLTASQLSGILAKHHQFMNGIRAQAAGIKLDPSLQELAKVFSKLGLDAAQAAVDVAQGTVDVAQGTVDALKNVPETLQTLWNAMKTAWSFVMDNVLKPFISFMGDHPLAQTFKAIMTEIQSLVNGIETATTAVLPLVVFAAAIPWYLFLTAVQSVVETINEATGLHIPDLSTPIANMETAFKAVYGNLGDSVSTLLAFFYRLSNEDYAHVGRLQAIAASNVEDGTGDVMLSDNSFFSSLYSKNEYLALSKLSFDEHSMKTYVGYLSALVS